MGILEGRVALVTGAGGRRGLGRAVALKLAGAGARVVLSDAELAPAERPPDEIESRWRGVEEVAGEVAALGGEACSITADLSDAGATGALVERALARFGRIDVLVNNARAVMGPDRAPVTAITDRAWEHVMAVNVTAAFRLTKLVGRAMVAAGRGGRILNIGSDCARVGRASLAAYCASKFALIGLTQASALDLAAHRITVNAICPGPIHTNRLSHWEREQADREGVSLSAYRARVLAEQAAQMPLGRLPEPEEVASLVVFLASDEAAMITGQAYNVNAGLLFH